LDANYLLNAMAAFPALLQASFAQEFAIVAMQLVLQDADKNAAQALLNPQSSPVSEQLLLQLHLRPITITITHTNLLTESHPLCGC
jgi:hypothetical protein